MSINQHNGRKLALTIHNSIKDNNVKSLEKNVTFNETIETKEETSNELLSKILDTINSNSLNIFYPDSNNDFKKKIDSLNLKFYLETEKYLSNKNRSEKCQTSLFIILFKQINIYIEEIERLNLIIIKRKYDPKTIMERTDELIKKQNEFLTKEKLIKTLKESKSNMETKLLESIINEDKLKKEIQNLKKENEIFKKQLSKNFENKSINFNKQKKKSSNLLYKLTHQTFHSSTIKNIINNNMSKDSINKEKNDLYYNQGFENWGNSRKRNNSDNSKTIIDNSLQKLYKYGSIRVNKGGRALFKNMQKKIGYIDTNNSSNNNNSSISNININHTIKTGQKTISTYLSKKPVIQIKLNNTSNGNELPNNLVNISQTMKKSINIDIEDIKPVKTEYVINDLDEYKKGFIYELNSSIATTDTKKSKENNKENKDKENNKDKDLKFKLCLKSKEIKDKNTMDNKDIISKRNTGFSSTQINTFMGKNVNERKKKHKINI
jgi:hypothetical protein